MDNRRLSARNAGTGYQRRSFLAAIAGLLATPVCLRGEKGFPQNFLGANTAITGYGLFEAIELLRELGFKTIELQNLVGVPEPTRGQFPGFRLDEADRELRARLKESLHGFQLVTTHLPYQGLEYFAADGERARRGIEAMERALAATAFLGAKIGVVHPKPGPGMNLEETWPLMVHHFRKWGDIAKAGGFRLALETGYPTSVVDFVRLVEQVDHECVGAALDVGHQGKFDDLVSFAKPELRGTPDGIKAYNDVNVELIEKLGTKLIHLHVHDIEPSTWREHKPLIYDFIDYPRLLGALRKISYEGVLVFEIGGPATKMPTFLRDAKRKLDMLLQA